MFSRKRQRLDTAVRSSSDVSPATDKSPTASMPSPPPNGHKPIRKARSWYESWPRPPKAAPSTSVARENILGGTVRGRKAPDLGQFDIRGTESDSASVGSNAQSLSKIAEDADINRPLDKIPATTEDSGGHDGPGKRGEIPPPPPVGKSDACDTQPKPTEEAPHTPPRPATATSWLGWIARTPFVDTQDTVGTGHHDHVTQGQEGSELCSDPGQSSQAASDVDATPLGSKTPPKDPTITIPASTSSWFGLWTASAGPPSAETASPKDHPIDADVQTQTLPPQPLNTLPKAPSTPRAGSSWAFWSRDTSTSDDADLKSSGPGEIAVIGEASESQPTPMAEDDMSGIPDKDLSGKRAKDPSVIPTVTGSWTKKKRSRPVSVDVEPSSGVTDFKPSEARLTSATPSPISVTTETDRPKPTHVDTPTSTTQATANLLLPAFSSTYHIEEPPSVVKQVTKYLFRAQETSAKQVFRLGDPPKIRKAIAIGIHGWFPATYFRPMIGQPTGTSLRFASLCSDAIRKWADQHGCGECEIEKVALQGEGKVSERVDNLWKLVLNWIEHIRAADLIMIACHSQGVPVSIMLLEKLLDLGIITTARFGVCAMAGVSMGPFSGYTSSILMGSAAELYDFANPESANAQRFQGALKRVLDHGGRVTFVGSIDDQVVPLESAVYSPAHHPHIYRAVFIDGRVHASDFIAHLVGFALKLRNMGISDHGLIRELSAPLAGSLYSGEGHSRLYYEAAVYELSVKHVMETTAVDATVTFDRIAGDTGERNPYLLPWIMRGLLEEEAVKTHLREETAELLSQFDAWNPTNKALKDVKYRLEAVRSRL